jgi:hypothetical protein
MQSDKALLEKIETILRAHFPKDTVDVSLSGIRDNIHVMVVSRAFDPLTERQKQEYLWDLIDKSDLTKKQKLRISLILPVSTAELK